MRKQYSNTIYQKSFISQSAIPRRISLVNNNQNYIFNSYTPQNNIKEFKDILPLLLKDSNSNFGPPYNSVKVLSLYIRRNRNSIEETINQLSQLLQKKLNNIKVNFLINIVNSILVLLTEKSQIINFLDKILPILVFRLYNNFANLSLIENLNNTIGNLIKIGGIYIQRNVENFIDNLFYKLNNNDPKDYKHENLKFALILFLCKIIENSSLFAYNKITEQTTFGNFKKIIDDFKDPKYEVRYAVGELINQFNHLLKNRDYKTKYSYEQMIYFTVEEAYKTHLKENNDAPNNLNIVLGFIEVLRKIYISEPLFLKEEKLYKKIVDLLMKCSTSKNYSIRAEFIKFVPELYQINKEVFMKNYLIKFLKFNNKYLTLKANNEIRNSLLITLGSLSLVVKDEIFNICKEQLLNVLNELIMEKNIFDVEIFKCLADLLHNKENLYIEVIVTKFDIYSILSKLFKNGLTTYKIEFLIAIMTAFSSFSMEHISTVIASLNVISLILWDEDFKLEYFYKEIDDKKDNFIDPKLEGILINIKKYIRKYMSTLINTNITDNQDNNKNYKLSSTEYIKNKNLNDWRIIIFALTLFSQIENSLFLKDMLIFYNDKILPYLLFSSNKIKKKILELILCKFVKIFPDDINYSNFILYNIIDSIRNLLFSVKDLSTRIFAFNILHKKELFLDLILKRKENFFSKLTGLLSTNEEQKIKEKLIQTIGILASRSENKNYFLSFVKKSVNNILFTIGNSEDIIHKENLISLLLYYTIYLKNFYNLNLIEKIIEVLINLNINYDYQGIIFIDTLKIIYELLNTDLINYNFLTNKINNVKINQYCHFLLIICVNNLKEGGDNTTKTEILLKVLYQIVKIKKINIYQDINKNFINESLDYLNNNFYKNSISFNKELNKKKFKSQKSNKSNISIEKGIEKEKMDMNNNEISFIDNYYNELLSNLKMDEIINLSDILIQCIIKGINDESLKTVMNIFGFSGALDPSEKEKFSINQDISSYYLDGNLYEQDYYDDIEFKLTKFNKKTKMFDEINLSDIEPATYKPILYIIKILKENSQQDLIGQIINNFKTLIDNLEQKDEKLIEIIFPTIIQVIPQVENNYQKILFSCINMIIKDHKEIAKENLNDLVQLTIDYIIIEECSSKCCNILNFLLENFIFEMEIYYPLLIPIFLSFLNKKITIERKDKKEKIENIIIENFCLMTKNSNISSYLEIILDELSSLFLISTEFDYNILEFFTKIVSLQNTYDFYPLIINTLIEKINIFMKENTSKEKNKNTDPRFVSKNYAEENKNSLKKIVYVFLKMNQINREHFINFLPMIVKNLKAFGLLRYINFERSILPMIIEHSSYIFMKLVDFENMISSQSCVINCIYGFNNLAIKRDNKTKKQSEIINKTVILNSKTNPLLRKSSRGKTIEQNQIQGKEEDINNSSKKSSRKNTQFLNQSNKNRKNSINNDLIIKAFETSNCVIEEDWHEWFKSTTKVLFDQSPSYTLYYCRFIADYNFPLIVELYNYAFFLVYTNNNDQNKKKLTDDLQNALNNPKTPNEILLTILNLAEFIERRNVNMIIFDYLEFGKVAYKCRAFAKALYYKENDFMNKNDFDNIEDLIELYYELKLPESAVGLLKLAEKNKNKIKRRSMPFFDRRSYASNNLPENERSSLNFEKNDKDKEYIWYIKMHNYNEALNIIIKQLKKEKNKKNIDILKKNKDICLNGLYDWEELLSSNESYNDDSNEINDNGEEFNIINLQETPQTKIIEQNKINEINTSKKEGETVEEENIQINDILKDENQLKEKIEKEILLSKACMNLGEWNELKKHFNKIKELFKNNNVIDEQFLINNNEEKKSDLYEINDINDDNIASSIDESENIFFINHGLNYGTNMDPLENDFINLNKYVSNYNKIKSKTKSFSFNNNSQHNNHNNKQINNNEDLEQEIFISYQELINNNQKLSFLENNEEILFDLNLYSSILNIQNNRYNLAQKYISSAKKIILSKIKSLLNESYTRGYELLVKNQILYNLEQIIDYKQNHFNDKPYFNQMLNLWNKNLDNLGKDPYIYEKFLAIRSLILPIDQEYNKYMDLSKICRKLNLYLQSEKILLRLKNKLNIKDDIGESNDLRMNEIQIKIELNYNKCLFEKGDINDAIDKSKYIVDLLENAELNNVNGNNILCKLSDKIKSQIYGNYAIYKQKNFIYNNRGLQEDYKEINNFNILHQSHGFFKKSSHNYDNNNPRKNSVRIIQPQKDEESDMINHYFNLSTKYNNNSYKLWHTYAMFNYKYYKFIYSNTKKEQNNKRNKTINNKEISFAINAVKGFKNSLSIGGKNRNKTFQDLLRLIDIFFSSGDKSDNLLTLISESFNNIDNDAFLNVIPQLLCRFDLKESKILDVLFEVLTKIGLAHPHAIISPLIVMKYSSSKKRKSGAKKVLSSIINKNYDFKKLIDECEMFVTELNKCAMLIHEEWFETIEEISKTFQSKDYISFANQMMKLHEKMIRNPRNMYEIHFYQKFNSDIAEAEEYLRQYINTKENEYAKEAWEIYHRLYKKLLDHYKTFESISLEYISPKLDNFQESNIALPGTYLNNENIYEKEKKNIQKNNKIDENDKNEIDNINNIIRIKKLGKTLSLFNTKQHPRKMTMIGTDNKEYMFLLKGHEDLRQDERVMQLFDLVNTIMAKDNDTYNKKLFINTYAVFPLSHSAGIIGWVPNCDTLHQLIKNERASANTISSVEHRKVYKLFPKFESGTFLGKVEVFKEALNETHGKELNTVIYKKSKNCETWLNRRTNYSRSLAVMSIVGYILGLGDRHPSNLMMSRKTGKIIHIDFGDCFEVAMKRDKFPEKVPFRLTRMLIKALEVSGIEGTFRLICIKIMELLRNNKDSLLAILGSFIHDPLISFRLMIPMIMKKRKREVQNSEKKKNEKNKLGKNLVENENKIIEINYNNNNNDININNIVPHSVTFNCGSSLLKLHQLLKYNEEMNKNKEKEIDKGDEKEKNNEKDENEKDEEKNEDIKVEEKIESIHEEEEKKEKKKMEDDERQIFNLFEEKDQIESEELNEIAQIVLDRIQDKLSGTDFYPNLIFDAKTQVDKLIAQATSYENLAQSYLGWCPFW